MVLDGVSSMFFAFADLVIHSIFNTERSDTPTINNASSYLDLSPLYGSSEKDVGGVRRMSSPSVWCPVLFTDLLVVTRQGRHWTAARGRLCGQQTAFYASLCLRSSHPPLPKPQCKPSLHSFCLFLPLLPSPSIVHRPEDPFNQRKQLLQAPGVAIPRGATRARRRDLPTHPARQLRVLYADHPRRLRRRHPRARARRLLMAAQDPRAVSRDGPFGRTTWRRKCRVHRVQPHVPLARHAL